MPIMPEQDAPLASLCSICYTDPPKYVCPRDRVRTCSLACYKKHQQRASCNGKRDPTAYVKKEELASAAGIDHDFNFLTGIERAFDNADKDVELRGIGDDAAARKKRWVTEGPLQRYLRNERIFVDKAPMGMGRQRANQTRVLPKSKKIVWTVEWIEQDGKRRLTEVYEDSSVEKAYADLKEQISREDRKRKAGASLASGPKSPKQQRKSSALDSGTTKSEEQVRVREPAGTANAQAESSGGGGEKVGAQVSIQTEADVETISTKPTNNSTTHEAEHTAVPTNAHPGEVIDDPTQSAVIQAGALVTEAAEDQPHKTRSSESASSPDTRSLLLEKIQSEQARQAACRASKAPSGPPFFYLTRPRTASAERVVIPLIGDNTLTVCLRGQTVLEFPTIYVLDCPADGLDKTIVDGKNFIRDSDYRKREQEEEQEVRELLGAVPYNARFDESADQQRRNQESSWDESKILEMLKRDVKN